MHNPNFTISCTQRYKKGTTLKVERLQLQTTYRAFLPFSALLQLKIDNEKSGHIKRALEDSNPRH